MKKTVVNREDYDFYSIKLPLRLAFSRRLKKVVLKEVEKRHPKLSLSSCLDSHFSVKNGKLQADVAVIEQKRLSNYRRLFPGKKLLFENEGDKRKKAFFTEKKIKLKILYGFLISIFIFCSTKIIQEVLMQHKRVIEKERILLSLEETDKNKTELPMAAETVSSVFSSVSKKGGKLSSFSWDGENCSFSVNGCHNDDIFEAQCCVVSYMGSRPYFSFTVPVRNENNEISGILGLVDNPFPKIRDKLTDLGVEIRSEHIDSTGAELNFLVSQSILYSFLKILGTEAEAAGWIEKNFSIEKNGEKNLVKVSFDRSFEGQPELLPEKRFSPLLITASYAWLFKAEDLQLVASHRKPAKKGYLIPGKESQKMKKIGEIRKTDGALLIYYRNPEGKIIFEEVGNAM